MINDVISFWILLELYFFSVEFSRMQYIFIVVLDLKDKSSEIFTLKIYIFIADPSYSSRKLPVIFGGRATFIPYPKLNA